VESPLIERLNIGPISTMTVSWDQPHEGNMFEFLYKRRAILRLQMSTPTIVWSAHSAEKVFAVRSSAAHAHRFRPRTPWRAPANWRAKRA
jgi:hypothetical protein